MYDDKKFYTNQKCFIITCKSQYTDVLIYLTAYLNSRISQYWIRNNCPELQGGTRELSKVFFEKIPIPPITNENKNVVSQIESLVDQILLLKKQDPNVDTTKYEREIDQLVYKLYELTPEEIKIVEKSVK